VWVVKFLAYLIFAVGLAWDAYTHDTWHWWLFLVLVVPCFLFVQFRAGMVAERSGMTSYAMARPGQVIFWALVQAIIYGVIITAFIGYLLGGRF